MKPVLTVDKNTLEFLPPAIHQDDLGGANAISNELLYADLCDITGFDIRICNALSLIGVTKVHELVQLKRIDLLKAPGIGKMARTLIYQFLADHQLVPVNSDSCI